MAEPLRNVRFEVGDRTAWITVDRPDKLNALDRLTIDEIGRAVSRAVDDEGVGVIVLTGAGQKAFVAGADIAEMARMDARDGQLFSRQLMESLSRIERAPKPVIAAVNGFALGGGCELALACHVRIASESAKFGQPEVNLGLIPGAGGTQRLQRLVGRGRALDLVLTGDMIDAAEALRIGLVSRVFPDDRFREEMRAIAERLAAAAPLALRTLKANFRDAERMNLAEFVALESERHLRMFGTHDTHEAFAAKVEKRKPRFLGR